MAPGITKLNIPKMQSPKNAIATNLGSKPRSTGGVSYGIFAQRSATGLGLHSTNRGFNSLAMSELRHSLNDNRTVLNNNIGNFHSCNHNGGNTMNKYMAAMMAMNMLGNLGSMVADAIGGAKTDAPTSKRTNAPVENQEQVLTSGNPQVNNNGNTNKYTNINTSLADNTTQIKNLAGEVNNFDEGTNQKIKNLFNTGSKALEGLTLAGLNVDSIANINLKDVNLGDDPSFQEIKDAATTIENNVKTYQTKIDNIQGNITTCETKRGKIQQGINNIQSSTALTQEQKQQQIQQLQNQMDQLDAAINALKQAKQEVENDKKELEQKKNEMNQLKEQKENLLDQRRNLADKDKKELEKLNTQKNKLKGEIDGLRGKAYSAKDKEKLNKKIKEFNNTIAQMQGLYTSLNSLGLTSVTKADGTEAVDLSSLSNYANIESEKIDELPVADSNTKEFGQNAPSYATLNIGETARINGVLYKKINDNEWVDERGNRVSSLDVVGQAFDGNAQLVPAIDNQTSPLGGGTTGLNFQGFPVTPRFESNDPEGTVTIGNDKYIPMGDKYMRQSDGWMASKELVFGLQTSLLQNRDEA